MGLFDVHAHLTDPRLAAREHEVVARARAAGVTTILSNGLNPADNEAVAALAARHPDLIRPCFGLYPVDAVLPDLLALGEDYPRDTEPVPAEVAVQWVADHVEEAFAIGEVGLDRYWVPAALWERQEAVFRELVALALAADKPLIVHTRKAEARAFEVLKELGATRVDWHCYSSRVKRGVAIAEHGHWLSIPANARRAENFSALLRKLPRDKVLLETDCPYLGPDRDAPNEPANVTHTLELAVELWGCSEDAAEDQLASNFEALFGCPP